MNENISIVYHREETTIYYKQNEFVVYPFSEFGKHETVIHKQVFRQENKAPDNFIAPIISDTETDKKDVFDRPIKKSTKTTNNLVLFIQAEAGMQLLQKIRENNKLLPEFSNDLYLYTMRLWVGNETEFNRNPIKISFDKNASSGVVPKNDFVMLRFEFDNAYKGFEKNAKDYDRMDYFNAICQDELVLVQVSERLAFDDSKGMESWER